MTLATYTATTFNAQPKAVPTGNQTISGKFQWTAAGSVGDVVFLAKIPNGATIVDCFEYHTSGQTAAVIDFGLDRGVASGGAGNASCLISGGALATMNRMSLAASPTGAPVVVSLSDLDPVRYAVFIGKAASATFTITVSGGFSITYRTDGPETV